MSRPAPIIPGRGGRPPPPPRLSKAERQIWLDVVASRPPNYFDAGTWPLLEAFCLHSVVTDGLAAEVRSDQNNKRLRDEHRKQSAMVAMLATKLRLAKMQRRQHQSSEERETPTPRRRLWVVPPTLS
jgi:hypothetical protein